ncbi:MAG: hypothetical protein ACREGH_03000 [Minisyncoccia bacterium]
MTIGEKASIPNLALKSFEKLVGEWAITGSHPYLPGTILHGRASVSWLEGGAFLIMRSEIDKPEFPQGIEIFGSDDAAKGLYMLHFDERGISRKYDVTFKENGLRWWRDDPAFSQRFTLTIEDDGNKMRSRGEMSRDGGAWEGDLELTYDHLVS